MLTKVDVPHEYFPKVYVYQKRKGQWWWKYQLPDGAWYYVSVGDDEKRAKKNARLKERDLSQGLFNSDELARMQESVEGSPITVDAAMEKYLRLTAPIKSGDTRRGESPLIREAFRFVEKECGVTQFGRITERHILLFRDHLIERVAKGELKAISANNKLKYLKKVFRWYKKRKEIFSNPASDIDPIPLQRSEKSRSVVFSEEQIWKLIAAPYEDRSGFNVKAFAVLLYSTGLRPGEARHLEWDDIDWANRLIRIRHKPGCPTKYGLGWKPKWGKERIVYLNDAALMILKRLSKVSSVGFVQGVAQPANFVFVTKDRKRGPLASIPWQRVDSLQHAWRELLESAGLVTVDGNGNTVGLFSCHDLRRTWSAHAKNSGEFTVDEASKVLGHDPTVNIQHYSGGQEVGEQMREKMRRHPSNRLVASHCYPIVTTAKK